jgi:hypothetical protein
MEKAEVGDSLTPLKCNRNGRERSGTSWTVLFARRTSPWRVDELSKRGLGVVQSEVAWPWPLLTRNQDQIAISQKLQILGTICSGEITGIGWECLEYFSLGRTHTHAHRPRQLLHGFASTHCRYCTSFFQQWDTLRYGDIHTGGNHVQMARRDTWPEQTNKGKGQSQQMSWKSGAQSSKAQNHTKDLQAIRNP